MKYFSTLWCDFTFRKNSTKTTFNASSSLFGDDKNCTCHGLYWGNSDNAGLLEDSFFWVEGGRFESLSPSPSYIKNN